MSVAKETVADIVAEMRSCDFDDPRFDGCSVMAARALANGWANRIEATHGRTTIALRNIGAVNARLHAALKNAVEVLDAVGPLVLAHDDSCILTQGVSDAVNMAKRVLNKSEVAK